MKTLFSILFILMVMPLSAGKVVEVDKIKITGLVNIDKYNLMRGVKTGIRGKRILIDLDSLEKKLEGNSFIRNYLVEKRENILVIEVTERYPLINVVFTGKNMSLPCVVDRSLNIVKSGIFFKTDMPIVIIGDEKSDPRDRIHELEGVFKDLLLVKNRKPVLFNELEQLEIMDNNLVLVSCRNRKTRMLIEKSLYGFTKLEGTLKVLDSRNVYPGFLDLTKDLVLIK